ncbi:MAG TPA: hypothetical protein VLB32_04240 [Candidatus Acidoferrales bacterium]|nr:hypothetical protein [Candidatus Acidoferrales bacterium]
MGILLGGAHLLFVPLNFDRLTLGALWFAGAGLAIVFAGFLNLALARSVTGDRLLAGLALTANLFLALMFGVALSLLTQPQVVFGLALFLAQAATAYALGRVQGSQRQGPLG